MLAAVPQDHPLLFRLADLQSLHWKPRRPCRHPTHSWRHHPRHRVTRLLLPQPLRHCEVHPDWNNWPPAVETQGALPHHVRWFQWYRRPRRSQVLASTCWGWTRTNLGRSTIAFNRLFARPSWPGCKPDNVDTRKLLFQTICVFFMHSLTNILLLTQCAPSRLHSSQSAQ